MSNIFHLGRHQIYPQFRTSLPECGPIGADISGKTQSLANLAPATILMLKDGE